jgi:ABC-type dipeptide/oligopeptide/nickel transport system permease component
LSRYVIARLLAMIPVLIGITAIVFFAMRLVPGDPAVIMFGAEADPGRYNAEAAAEFRRSLGLDRPLPVQFVAYVGKLASGDFGRSIRQREPVLTLILERLPATLELAVAAMLIAVLIGVPTGVVSAVRAGGWFDRAVLAIASFLFAAPAFWVAMMLIALFSIRLGWLPTSGRGDEGVTQALIGLPSGGIDPLLDSLRHLILPAVNLSLAYLAVFARLTRSSLLETLADDYVRTARAKGLLERTVLLRHALRNAMLPLVTAGGLYFAYLMGGTVLIEVVFAWPGIGRLGITALRFFDYPLVQGVVLFTAIIFSVSNLVVDLLYSFIDPRVRYR